MSIPNVDTNGDGDQLGELAQPPTVIEAGGPVRKARRTIRGKESGVYQIFVSYRVEADEQIAQAMKILLEACISPKPSIFVASTGGLEVSSVGFKEQIATAARGALAFIGIFTNRSKSREWINFEAGAAWGQGALYAPVLVDIGFDELPTTVSHYQAVRAKYSSEIQRMVATLANSLGASVVQGPSEYLKAFDDVISVYPASLIPNAVKSVQDMMSVLQNQKYSEAERIRAQLWANAADEDERATIQSAFTLCDERLSDAQRAECLDQMPQTYRDVSPVWNHVRALAERRAHVAAQYWRRSIKLNPNPALFATIVDRLAQIESDNGDVEAISKLLLPLLRSDVAVQRSVAARRYLSENSAFTDEAKMSLVAIGLGGSPDEALYRIATELALNKWPAISCWIAQSFDKDCGTGTSANSLGIALSNAGFENLAYQAYLRSVALGVSVAKVNIANLLAHHLVPAAGLKLLQEHEESFDAASKSYPHSIRADIERVVQEEEAKYATLQKAGERQFRAWAEWSERALNRATTNANIAPSISLDGLEWTINENGKDLVLSHIRVDQSTVDQVTMTAITGLSGLWHGELNGVLLIDSYLSRAIRFQTRAAPYKVERIELNRADLATR